MNTETQQAILVEVMAEIEKRPKYHFELVYIDYRDGFDQEQVDALAAGDFEKLYESIWDWQADAQWEGARALLEDILGDLDDWDEAVLNEWSHTEAAQDAYMAIMERDESTPLEDLARNSGNVLLRITAIDEDHAYSFTEVDPVDCLTELGLPTSEANVKLMGDVLAECSPEFSVLMGFYMVPIYVSALYDLPAEGKVKITNPYIWMGNPFSGSGYLDGPFEGEVIVDRSDLRTDHGAWGYSWTEVCGGTSPRYYEEAKIEAVEEVNA